MIQIPGINWRNNLFTVHCILSLLLSFIIIIIEQVFNAMLMYRVHTSTNVQQLFLKLIALPAGQQKNIPKITMITYYIK